MKPEGGLSHFDASTETADGQFNVQLAKQLEQWRHRKNSGNDEPEIAPQQEESDSTVEENAETIETEDGALEFDLQNREHKQQLQATMKAYVTHVDSLEPEAVAVGLHTISCRDLVGEECFVAMRNKFTELQGRLAVDAKETAAAHERSEEDANPAAAESNVEPEKDTDEVAEIQMLVDEMLEISSSITNTIESLNTEESPTDTVDSSDSIESPEEAVEGLAEIKQELQTFVAQTEAFFQVASSWFEGAERTEEMDEYLNGLRADVKRAEELAQRDEIDDVEWYRESLTELTNSTAAYESHLRAIHEKLRNTKAEVAIPAEESAEFEMEPLVLTPGQRIDTSETVEDVATLFSEATEQMRRINTNPFIDPSERTTIQFIYDQLVQAVENGDDSTKVVQKSTNLQETISSVHERPDPSVIAERIDTILDVVNHVRKRHPDFVETVDALAENVQRIMQDEPANDARIAKAYQTLETHVLQHEEHWLTLGGMSIPAAGPAGVFGARSFREGLRLAVHKPANEIEKILMNEAISLLTVVPDTGLTPEQVERLRDIARQVQIKSLHAIEEGDESEDVEMEVKTGRIAVEADVDEEDGMLTISVKDEDINPESETNSGSLEPTIADETVEDTSWDTPAKMETDVPAEPESEPVWVESEPDDGDVSESDSDTREDTEEQGPVTQPERTPVQSWQERREQAGTSVAKRIIQGQLLERLKAKGITPGDIDRKVNAEIHCLDSNNAPSWFERLTVPNPVFRTFKDKTLAAIESIRKEYPAGYQSQFEERYQASHAVFYGELSDFITKELTQVVPDYSPTMTLEELIAVYIATQETE